MRQPGGGHGLQPEALLELVVTGQSGMQDLDGDRAVEDLVLAFPNLGHAAAVDQSDEAVPAGQDGLCDDPRVGVGHHLRVLTRRCAAQVSQPAIW